MIADVRTRYFQVQPFLIGFGTSMNRRTWRGLLLVLPLVMCGGCSGLVVSPNVAQVQGWAAKELPPGSTKPQVKEFCARHGFDYFEPTEPDRPGQRYLGGWRVIDTGLWIHATTIGIHFRLDDADRVPSVSARREEWWL